MLLKQYENGTKKEPMSSKLLLLRRFKSGKITFTLEEIKAITTTAKDYNMLTAAHAHGDEGMQRAILGGIKPSNMALS
jgi:imidazolonepropionase-like amidohydrolase